MILRDFWKLLYKDLKAKCGEMCDIGKHGLIIPYIMLLFVKEDFRNKIKILQNKAGISTKLLRDL